MGTSLFVPSALAMILWTATAAEGPYLRPCRS